MHFKEYHPFTNEQRLTKAVSQVASSSQSSIITRDFIICHRAMLHKLISARHYLVGLTNQQASYLGVSGGLQDEFFFEVNRNVDGFFTSCASALDILAREILVLFGELSLFVSKKNIYFQSAEARLKKTNPNDPIIKKIAAPNWLTDFKEYRNALTHELLIATNITVSITMSDSFSGYQESLAFKLADDPRVVPADRTYRKQREILTYEREIFYKLLQFINPIYGELSQRITQKQSLPL